MVYNPNQEGIDAVRLASGNLLDEYPDTEITKRLNAAFGKIQLGCKRAKDNPFAPDSVEIDFAQQIELNLAAMWSLKAYGPEHLDKIRELRAEVTEDLAILVEGTAAIGDTSSEDIEDIIESTDPKSWNLNPDIPVPNRMKTKHSGTTSSIEAQF